ncbi:hypothetical protein JZ751_026883, partial [Albula glossodonta]
MQMKILGMRPRKPRRFFGAISPRYMGTTLRLIPAEKGEIAATACLCSVHLPADDHHFQGGTGPAEAHESSRNEDEHSGVHQCPFPVKATTVNSPVP